MMIQPERTFSHLAQLDPEGTLLHGEGRCRDCRPSPGRKLVSGARASGERTGRREGRAQGRQEGFTSGQPMDIRTAEKCTASLWLSGQSPENASCPIETVLLRAACQ